MKKLSPATPAGSIIGRPVSQKRKGPSSEFRADGNRRERRQTSKIDGVVDASDASGGIEDFDAEGKGHSVGAGHRGVDADAGAVENNRCGGGSPFRGLDQQRQTSGGECSAGRNVEGGVRRPPEELIADDVTYTKRVPRGAELELQAAGRRARCRSWGWLRVGWSGRKNPGTIAGNRPGRRAGWTPSVKWRGLTSNIARLAVLGHSESQQRGQKKNVYPFYHGVSPHG